MGNLGVEHILTQVQSPQTIGKIESFHRNIQKELLRRKEFTIKEVRQAVEEYVEYYNFERVRMASATSPLRTASLMSPRRSKK